MSLTRDLETSAEATARTTKQRPFVVPNATKLLNFFFHRREPYAQQQPDGSYRPVNRRILPRDIRQHLRGDITLGAYSTAEDSTVRWVCFDLDTTNVGPIYALLGSIRGPHFLEFSGNKGFHIFQFFSAPVPASYARAYGNSILDNSGVRCEVFPKQDTLVKGSLGNLVKLPFGIHRVTGLRSEARGGTLQFVDFNKLYDSEHIAIPALQQNYGEGESWIEEIFSGQVTEERNNKANRLVYWLGRRGFPQNVIELVVEEANRCFSPPLDEAELATLLRERQ